MKLFTFFLLFALFISGRQVYATTPPDSSKSIFEKGSDTYKMQKARTLFLNRDYQAALEVYESLIPRNGDNALLNFRLGECLLAMMHYQTAFNYLEKAMRLNPAVDKEFYLVYGKTLHHLEKLDEALVQYEKYKSTLDSNKFHLSIEVNLLMEQVKYAREMMQKQVDVTITSLGDIINSKYDDHGPSISADGKTLIYTSRRPETTGASRDPEDKKYYEDIYIANWNEAENRWNKGEQIPGRLNTDVHDGCLSISPDGSEIFVYKNSGEGGSGEIYASRLSSSGKWGTAKELGKNINTSYFESSASVTADGKTLYFISERKGGSGLSDIYVSHKITKTEWGPAVNIGRTINTSFDERMVFIHPNGKYLFFSSDGHSTLGGYDIFVCRFNDKDSTWGKPVNLGYPINTVNDEINFTLTSNGKKAYMSAFKIDGLGEVDIFEIDLSRYDVFSLSEANAPGNINKEMNLPEPKERGTE